jgi:hypothetical protein
MGHAYSEYNIVSNVETIAMPLEFERGNQKRRPKLERRFEIV